MYLFEAQETKSVSKPSTAVTGRRGVGSQSTGGFGLSLEGSPPGGRPCAARAPRRSASSGPELCTRPDAQDPCPGVGEPGSNRLSRSARGQVHPPAPRSRPARGASSQGGCRLGWGVRVQGGRKGPGRGFPGRFRETYSPLPFRSVRPGCSSPAWLCREFVREALVLPSARPPRRGVQSPARTSPWWAASRALEPAWLPRRLPMGEEGGGFGEQRGGCEVITLGVHRGGGMQGEAAGRRVLGSDVCGRLATSRLPRA